MKAGESEDFYTADDSACQLNRVPSGMMSKQTLTAADKIDTLLEIRP
jgi:hypothetical protein